MPNPQVEELEGQDSSPGTDSHAGSDAPDPTQAGELSSDGGFDQDSVVVEVLDPDPPPISAVKSGRKAGRPPKDEVKLQKMAGRANAYDMTHAKSDYWPTIPGPKYQNYASDHVNMNQRTPAALTYWKELPVWAKQRVVGYVYREWPILAVPDTIATAPIGGDKTGEREYLYIDKLPGEEPLNTADDFLQRWGAGSYKLILNAVEDKQKRSLFTLKVYNLGSNDLKSHPPTDRHTPKYVDMNRPENRSYIEFLRGRGELPSQLDQERERANVAQVSAVKEAVSEVRGMSDKMVDLAKEAGRAQGAADAARSAPPPGTDANVLKEVVSTLRETHKAEIDMLMDRFRALSADSKPQDITTVLSMAMDLAERLAKRGEGNGDSSGMTAIVSKLQDQVARMQEARIESLERMVATKAEAPNGPSLSEQIKGLRELKEVLDEVTNANPPAKETVVEAAANLGPAWLKDLIPIAQSVATIAQAGFAVYQQYNSRQAGGGGGGGQGMPVGVPVGYPQGQPIQPGQWARPNPGPGGMYPQAQPGPGPQQQYPGPVGLPAPAPAAAPPGAETMDFEVLLDQISLPLRNHLADPELEGSRGGAFAEWFVGGFGTVLYDQIIAVGPDALNHFLTSHPRLGPQLAAISPDGALIREFTSDFCGHKFDEGEGDGEEGKP